MRARDQLELGNVHATSVARGNDGVLLIGPTGSGKSDLALRLIDRGWSLVSDDRVMLTQLEGAERPIIHATAPPALAGKLEVAGLGVCKMPFQLSCDICLIADLRSDYTRFPFDAGLLSVGGSKLPYVILSAFECSSPIRIEMAFTRALTQNQ